MSTENTEKTEVINLMRGLGTFTIHDVANDSGATWDEVKEVFQELGDELQVVSDEKGGKYLSAKKYKLAPNKFDSLNRKIEEALGRLIETDGQSKSGMVTNECAIDILEIVNLMGMKFINEEDPEKRNFMLRRAKLLFVAAKNKFVEMGDLKVVEGENLGACICLLEMLIGLRMEHEKNQNEEIIIEKEDGRLFTREESLVMAVRQLLPAEKTDLLKIEPLFESGGLKPVIADYKEQLIENIANRVYPIVEKKSAHENLVESSPSRMVNEGASENPQCREADPNLKSHDQITYEMKIKLPPRKPTLVSASI